MKSAIALLAIVIAVPVLAQDASVQLKSGTSITGRLVALDREGPTVNDGQRLVRSRWEDVTAIRSEQPVTATLANGDRVTLKVTGFADGRLDGTHETFGAIHVPIASLATTEAAPVPAPVPAPPTAPAKATEVVCCPATPLTPKPLKGKVAFSGTVRSGNTNSVLGALHAEITKDCAADRITAAIDALYGKTDDELSAASIGGKARWDHFFDKTFYGYASAEALHDEIQDLNLRAIASIGAGDFLWKKSDDCSWSIEGGISALYEDFSTKDEADLSPAGRIATTYKQILFTDLKLEEQLELLVPFDDFGRYLARSRTVLGMPLCKDLALRLSLEITYQGEPPSGGEALDVLGLVGIEYQF
jgi:putative salt-induced outer membrane protein YdiY